MSLNPAAFLNATLPEFQPIEQGQLAVNASRSGVANIVAGGVQVLLQNPPYVSSFNAVACYNIAGGAAPVYVSTTSVSSFVVGGSDSTSVAWATHGS
jgi:hypothetical protein